MFASAKSYNPSRPVHVLHAIGLVGVGKTRFLQEYFPTLPVFNLTTIYEKYQFSRQNLKRDITLFPQYNPSVRAAWDDFLRDNDPREDVQSNFWIGVESSGVNQALNVILLPFFPTVILIYGDPPPLSEEAFWETRPYGPTLNAILRKKLTAKTIPYTHLYNVITDTFSPLVPREFCVLSPQLASLIPKPYILAKIFSSSRMRKCPKCGAPFSTERLFTMHLQRHATHLKES